MGSQVGLPLGRVFYHKVHDGVSLQRWWEGSGEFVWGGGCLSAANILQKTLKQKEPDGLAGGVNRSPLRSPSPSCSNQRRLLTWRVRWTREWSGATLCQSQFASYEYRPLAPSRSRQRSACPERKTPCIKPSTKASSPVCTKYASSCLLAWGDWPDPLSKLSQGTQTFWCLNYTFNSIKQTTWVMHRTSQLFICNFDDGPTEGTCRGASLTCPNVCKALNIPLGDHSS